MASKEKAHDHVKDFLSFVDQSPTPYHAVHNVIHRLEAAGFERVRERENWSSVCEPGGKYYVTRNTSSIVAFAIGERWQPGNPVAAIGAHTDSPCLRVKPVSKRQSEGYLQVGVETYGGGLWHTWFDRDLSLAGRVMVKTKDGEFHSKLIDLHAPILRIPTLAIHLDRQEKFEFSKETQLYPIAGLAAAALNESSKDAATTDDKAGKAEAAAVLLKPLAERHHPAILDAVAKHCGTSVDAIDEFELVLYDFDRARLGGLRDELLFAPRQDNLTMCFCSTVGLVQSLAGGSLAAESGVRLISLFDHEEIGSLSAQGADSSFLPAVLKRLSTLRKPPAKQGKAADHKSNHGSPEAFEQMCADSFILSSDAAHAFHPNYAQKYEAAHHPLINGGPVLKVNANQRYMTNAPGQTLVKELARRAGVPLQLFVVPNGSPCGSTIGPMLAGKLGVRTLDLGNAQLSMHSIRETGGADDVGYAIRLFEQFFGDYTKLESKIHVD